MTYRGWRSTNVPIPDWLPAPMIRSPFHRNTLGAPVWRHAVAPSLRTSGVTACHGCPMPTDHRSRARAVNLTFRMTPEERERLQAEATAEGYETVQQLLEARVWGVAKPRRRPGRQPQEERLDVSA